MAQFLIRLLLLFSNIKPFIDVSCLGESCLQHVMFNHLEIIWFCKEMAFFLNKRDIVVVTFFVYAVYDMNMQP